MERRFGWIDIVRLGLVQTALGAILVLTTSTLNRVMVIEYALPRPCRACWSPCTTHCRSCARAGATPPTGAGARTPWIVGGMAVLGAGGVVAAAATALMAGSPAAGIAVAFVGFVLIGLGVGAAGTNVLILLAERVDDRRRAPAATIVWVMMIVGFIVTAGVAGALLDPFSPERLIAVAGGISVAAVLVAGLAVTGLEGPRRKTASRQSSTDASFGTMLAAVWRDPAARGFTVFIFASMLAYSAQDLILEPFAGLLYGLTPGQTTALGGVQNGGVLAGMLSAGLIGWLSSGEARIARVLMLAGCVGSAASLGGLALADPGRIPITPIVGALGFCNGVFAVSAIGAMMALAGTGPTETRGTRMGVWARRRPWPSGSAASSAPWAPTSPVTSSPTRRPPTGSCSRRRPSPSSRPRSWRPARRDDRTHAAANPRGR